MAENLECGRVPGHRSTHLTHACIDCGFPDSAVENGEPVPPCPAAMSAEILAMDHVALCRLWRFGKIGDPRMQGDLGELVRKRLFDDLGGFTPAISKQIGWTV